MNWSILDNINQLDELKKESFENPVLIFKHSTRCGVSRMVLKQFENDFDYVNVLPYFLDLLEYRNISNEIANVFGVVHQSPQILIIKNGICVYDASHNLIEANIIQKYL